MAPILNASRRTGAVLWPRGQGSRPLLKNEILQHIRSDAGAGQVLSEVLSEVLSVEPLARRRPPQGYAHVNLGTTSTPPTFDPARSKGVNGVTAVQDSGSGQYIPSRVCFDLTFTPNVAAGSPLIRLTPINNAAIVATATPPDNLNQNCPEGYRDAAVRTYANAGTETPLSFKIIFR